MPVPLSMAVPVITNRSYSVPGGRAADFDVERAAVVGKISRERQQAGRTAWRKNARVAQTGACHVERSRAFHRAALRKSAVQVERSLLQINGATVVEGCVDGERAAALLREGASEVDRAAAAEAEVGRRVEGEGLPRREVKGGAAAGDDVAARPRAAAVEVERFFVKTSVQGAGNIGCPGHVHGTGRAATGADVAARPGERPRNVGVAAGVENAAAAEGEVDNGWAESSLKNTSADSQIIGQAAAGVKSDRATCDRHRSRAAEAAC